MNDPECPNCKPIQLVPEATAVVSKGPNDSIDDPRLERWDTYRCDSCGHVYRVNSRTGDIKEIRLGG